MIQKIATDLLDQIKSNGIELTIEELLQYQEKSALIDLAAKKNQRGQLSGNYLARSKGRGMEFDEVRHYQNGDDIRTIDWRVTARTGKTHTKLFREEVERPVLIATDLGRSMQFGSQLLFKAVQAAHIAALVAWHAQKRGDRIGGIVFNQHQHSELKPRSRKTGVLHYLHALIQLQQQSIQNYKKNTGGEPTEPQDNNFFDKNCARLRHLARPGSLVYLITDGQQLSANAILHLSQISRHCELVIVQVNDPLEVELPNINSKINVVLTDGIQRQQLTLGDKKTALNYRNNAQIIATQQKELLTKIGAKTLHFTASKSLEQQLKQGVNIWIR